MKITNRRTKLLVLANIEQAITSLSDDIQRSCCEEDNRIDAESIRILAEAYSIIERGHSFNFASVEDETADDDGE